MTTETVNFWPDGPRVTHHPLPPLTADTLEELRPVAAPDEAVRLRSDLSQVISAMEAAASAHHREGRYGAADELGRFALNLAGVLQ